MKKKGIVSLMLAVCLVIALAACSGPSGNGGQLGGSRETGEGKSPADVSAAAMENFVKKLETANYVVTGGQDAVTNAVSPEQVYIVYGEKKASVTFAFMTLKGETFQTEIRGTGGNISEVEFVSTDSAVEVLGEILPNSWIGLSGGNMFELFYNDVEKPLEFTSNDMIVKTTVAGLGGYGEFTLSRMEEVHMIMDAEDPTAVRFTAVVPDAGQVKYDDLDLTLTFGAAKGEKRVEKWLKKPVYPEARTAWTPDDIATLDQVFFRDYGEKALPFPAVSSYAMAFDKDAYKNYSEIILRDPHWTERDVEDYRALLKTKGYKETSGSWPDGSSGTVLRLPLREEYGAYAQLDPVYDGGLVLKGALYHEKTGYDGREAINGAVEKYGFAPLPETDLFTGWNAEESAGAMSESWSYFFDYNFYMRFTLRFTDRAAAGAYLEAYADTLLRNGFVRGYAAGEGNGKITSPNACVSFQYAFSAQEDGAVDILFSDQKTLTVEEALGLLREHGLPEIDLHGDIASRDVARYHYELGEFEGLFLLTYQPYASTAEAEGYLDSLVPVLEEQGYYKFDPTKIGSQRQILYFNEELRKYVAFDLLPEQDRAQIFFEIVSIESELESDSLMMKAIGR